MRAAVILLLLAGCPEPQKPSLAQTAPVGITDDDRVSRMMAELQDDILGSYERDDPPEIETGMVQAAVGGARIGVASDDVLIGDELLRAPSRWPLELDRSLRTDIRSKRLETHLAADQTSAWTFDELSWRIPMCNRTAVIPLRLTSLYAHDGDRWVVVFEHLSFGHTAQPFPDGKLHGARIKSTVGTDLTDELSRVLQTGVFRTIGRERGTVATGPDALVLGPGIATEAHGIDAIMLATIPSALRSEDRRVGTIGRSPSRATVAYWIGNLVADLPPQAGGIPEGKVRLRGTFVFEQRKLEANAPGPACGRDNARCHWVLVQAHVSEPIEDDQLALQVFGTALISPRPLQWTCDDGANPKPSAQRETGPAKTAPP